MGQATTLLDEVSPEDDRVGRRIIPVCLQEPVERTQRRQSPIDGGDSMAAIPNLLSRSRRDIQLQLFNHKIE